MCAPEKALPISPVFHSILHASIDLPFTATHTLPPRCFPLLHPPQSNRCHSRSWFPKFCAKGCLLNIKLLDAAWFEGFYLNNRHTCISSLFLPPHPRSLMTTAGEVVGSCPPGVHLSRSLILSPLIATYTMGESFSTRLVCP